MTSTFGRGTQVLSTAVTPAPVPASIGESAPSPAPIHIELPTLNKSDAVIRAWIAALSANPLLAAWLIPDQLIRNPGIASSNRGRSPPEVFAFADPRLQALAPARKVLIRMGPDHRVKVQGKLEEFRDALDAAKRVEAGIPSAP